MNFFFPMLRRAQLPVMTGITLLGGLLGGVYGSLHDLLTYSISSEYFTRMKFAQFAHVNAGLSPRLFAAQIGFIAAGAVGLAAGWFIARTVVPAWPPRMAWSKALRAFLSMALIAAAAAAIGNLLGLKTGVGAMLWNDLCESLGVSDVPAFLRVALIHSAGYLGALAGLMAAILHLRRTRPHP
ncbi:MAG: hypothetical protein MUF86_10655 [Akkermansiaceae bacterium]|jgi:hypothetical protein|nr:hypothetical protein [Akkermansiaceae bacterium]MCU0778110.1 hypothetical protein [Akkermansiaceae bacterium]